MFRYELLGAVIILTTCLAPAFGAEPEAAKTATSDPPVVVVHLPDLARTRQRFQANPIGQILNTSWGKPLEPQIAALMHKLDLPYVLPLMQVGRRAALGLLRPSGTKEILLPFGALECMPQAEGLHYWISAFTAGTPPLLKLGTQALRMERTGDRYLFLPPNWDPPTHSQAQMAIPTAWKGPGPNPEADLIIQAMPRSDIESLVAALPAIAIRGDGVNEARAELEVTPHGLREHRSVTYSAGGSPWKALNRPRVDIRLLRALPADALCAFVVRFQPESLPKLLDHCNASLRTLLYSNLDPLWARYDLPRTPDLLAQLDGHLVLYAELVEDRLALTCRLDLPKDLAPKVLALLHDMLGLTEQEHGIWSAQSKSGQPLQACYTSGKLCFTSHPGGLTAVDAAKPGFWDNPLIIAARSQVPDPEKNDLWYLGLSRSRDWLGGLVDIVLRTGGPEKGPLFPEDLRAQVHADLVRSLSYGYCYEGIRLDGSDYQAESLLGGFTTIAPAFILATTVIGIPGEEPHVTLWDRLKQGTLFVSGNPAKGEAAQP